MNENLGTLYVVATPIGNMGDITYRAVDILSNVQYIYAEDTREFGKIAKKYNIKTKTATYNAHASKKTHDNIVNLLLDGLDVALVSDAGTPGISDPGSLIINYIIENYKEIKIVPIPGASAVISAVSVSGMMGNSFTFMGFVPHKKGRETFFNKTINSEIPCVFYESCHRILHTLNWYKDNAPDTKIMVAREITKMFETIRVLTAEQHLEKIELDKKELKGEFTILIYV